MRVLYVVHRYGLEVAGGAEFHCRQMAERLARRGHEVEVVTTCALDYTDWANFYVAGRDEVGGLAVHRLPVDEVRDPRVFEPLNARVPWGRPPVPLHLQRMWMRAQGPYVPSLAPWLYQHAPRFDVVVFFTYLYFTTYAGLPAAAGLVPTVLHPTAHEEPPLYLPLYDLVFRLPAAFAFSTEEEELLIRRRFRVSQLTRVVGVGCDLDATGDGQAFREQFGLGDRPYLLYVGRVEPAKGSDELFTLFSAYKDRHPGPLELVVVGDPVRPMAAHPDIVVTGFVDESVKNGAYAGALAMVQPSYFESFSMVVVEAWAHGVPVIVQGRCDVLAGQARRSGGGIAYTGFAEFEAAVDVLLEERALARRLGEAGRRYVRARYSWEQVLDTYEVLLEQARVGRLSPAR